LAIRLELGQIEDRHEALSHCELVQARDQVLRAAATEVVDQVVAVGRNAQLAEPPEDDRGRCVDVDRAVEKA
jgi:hypothetical protein